MNVGQALSSMSTLGTATARQHLQNVFDNAGYVNYDYGHAIIAKVNNDTIKAVVSDSEYIAVVGDT
jgi:hypothetical protein